jgi:protein-S-isoprenylcysteine O-methyltransferase Ste14
MRQNKAMRSLELRIPPPLVAALISAMMWALSRLPPLADAPNSLRTSLTIVIAVVGAGVSFAGVIAFYRARTTVNPMKPEATSVLVCNGIYAITRNPMYVGIALVLVAWAVWLGSPWAVAGPIAFVLYITRFQILPEERALGANFGERFSRYRSRVRRWI